MKKEPRSNSKQNRTQDIPQDELGSNGPIIKAKVGWMPEVLVYSTFYQDVIFLFRVLNHVIEAFTAGDHGGGSCYLTDGDEDQA